MTTLHHKFIVCWVLVVALCSCAKPEIETKTSKDFTLDGCTLTYQNKTVNFSAGLAEFIKIFGSPSRSRNDNSEYLYWDELGMVAMFDKEGSKLANVKLHYPIKYNTITNLPYDLANNEADREDYKDWMQFRPTQAFHSEFVLEGAKIEQSFDIDSINNLRKQYHTATKNNLSDYKPIELTKHVFGNFFLRTNCGSENYMAIDIQAFNREPLEINAIEIYMQWAKDFENYNPQ